MMKIIRAILNYLTWWLTAITGGLVVSLVIIFYIFIMIPVYIFLHIITAPLEYTPKDTVADPFGSKYSCIEYIQKYIGSKPF